MTSKPRKRSFYVTFGVEVEVSQALLDSVLTNEWSEQFYQLQSAGEVAAHMAYNLVRGVPLTSLDGFADQPGDAATLIGQLDVHEVNEIVIRPKPKKRSRNGK